MYCRNEKKIETFDEEQRGMTEMAETDVKNKKNQKNDGMNFLKKNARYIAAAVLLLVIVLILVKCSGSTGKEGTESTIETEQVVTEEKYQENAIPAVNELINNYFTAYANGDVVTLQTLATPITQNEQSYIALISQYIEAYQNINCYTKSGLDSSSYLVNVSLDVKFMGVDTAAPGLYFFYVRTNEDGSLYIDNLYSEYNLSRQESALDTSVRNLITTFYNSDDVIALQNEIQQKYEAALAADENLLNLCATTIPNAISEWRSSIVTDQPQESTEEVPATAETETPETETPEEQPADQPQEEQPAEPVTETVYAMDTVNIRAAADQTSEKIGSVTVGTALTRTGTDGDWSIIDYNGTTGYVKSEFLSNTAPEVPAENISVGGLTEGTVVRLSNTTNIRSSMSETADKVGVAYAGEKVTVVMSYAEGWTKVSWNNKTGYVKTDLLK